MWFTKFSALVFLCLVSRSYSEKIINLQWMKQRNPNGEALARDQMKYETQPNFENRIVGGTPVTPGRYPYFATLLPEVGTIAFCGGSLIAPNIVLTAAHCIGFPRFVGIGCESLAETVTEGCEIFPFLRVLFRPNLIKPLWLELLTTIA